MSKPRLLIVEENETERELLEMILGEDFDVDVLPDASNVLSAVSQKDYEIVITEISFDNQDGLEICKTIATDDALDPPAVVVVSKIEDETVIKSAFAAGIYDYFKKPFNVIVFHESMLRIVGLIEQAKKQKKERKATQSVLANTLSQAAFYGTGLEIIADLNRASSYERIARKVLKNLELLNIFAAIQFRVQDEVHTFDWNDEVCDDRTLRVFDLLVNEGRIYRFGKRLMFNDQHTSLFVKQINDKDGTTYDAILDMGAKLVPAVESRVIALKEHNTLVKAQHTMNDILQRLQGAIIELAESKRQAVENITTKISLSFHELDLTEEQESFFANMIEKEIKQRNDDESLKSLSELLHDFNAILQEAIESEHDEEDDEDDFQELEFF
ncbi:response regulator [Aestuariibacter sp. AA17]|uniref:Response regulator n=1 Tax=Fluctibacter corallii TaxID=2984329 RepID=A0ABT3ACP0_9ALTE|nr:response regulator [Aestuariibacter sp. AA17]MCV2886437.1 response regulator [Aestuariibacter sp. AA17]